MGCAERNLFVVVGHFAVGHDFAITIDLAVAFVGVDNHVEVFIGTENLGNDITEALFENAHECRAVDIFRLLEFRECVDETDCLNFLSCHILFYFVFSEREGVFSWWAQTGPTGPTGRRS